MEDLRSSILDTEFDPSLKSFSGSTSSMAVKNVGTNTCMPSKSRRNKSAEFVRILAKVSPHSFP